MVFDIDRIAYLLVEHRCFQFFLEANTPQPLAITTAFEPYSRRFGG